MTLDELNALTPSQAYPFFEQACAAKNWVSQMVANRPYYSLERIETQAKLAWKACNDSDVLEAFTAHPMIGDVDSLRAKFANTKAIASGEQSGTAQASEETLLALKQANEDYLKKHGFIFIICATGLSADTMLNALLARLPHTTAEEMRIAAGEQLKITLLRLKKALTEEEKSE